MAHYSIEDFRDEDGGKIAPKGEAESLQPSGNNGDDLQGSDVTSDSDNTKQNNTGADASRSSDVSTQATSENSGDTGMGNKSGKGSGKAGTKPKK